jgi:membrane-bound serine protease (ClpP class)
LDGTTIERFDGRKQVLRLADAEIITVEKTFAERVLMVIADPQVAYLLLMLGFLGIMVEVMSPGIVVPGVGGGISVLLALYAFSVLPVNSAGLLLIALGVGLLVAEAFVTSYGLLTLGGAVTLVLGSLMLVDTPIPAWRIGWGLVLPTVVVLVAASFFLLSRVWRLRRAKAKSGLDAIVGEVGELATAIERSHGEGTVFVHGEYWTATADEPVQSGAKVRVERVEGTRLRIAPIDLVPT